MKPLYTEKEFSLSKSFDKLPCECLYCGDVFLMYKTHIKDALNPKCKRTGSFCSKECVSKSRNKKIEYNCHNCGKLCSKKISQVKLSKSGLNFCSKKCTSSYHILHKTWGSNRSKLELWLGNKLLESYKELTIIFNDTKTIGLELDILIPELNLAFEINGIFHYEPIFGIEKLKEIQIKDCNKYNLCNEKNISLITINTSKQKYFKESTSEEFLNIIKFNIDYKGLSC